MNHRHYLKGGSSSIAEYPNMNEFIHHSGSYDDFMSEKKDWWLKQLKERVNEKLGKLSRTKKTLTGKKVNETWDKLSERRNIFPRYSRMYPSCPSMYPSLPRKIVGNRRRLLSFPCRTNKSLLKKAKQRDLIDFEIAHGEEEYRFIEKTGYYLSNHKENGEKNEGSRDKTLSKDTESDEWEVVSVNDHDADKDSDTCEDSGIFMAPRARAITAADLVDWDLLDWEMVR